MARLATLPKGQWDQFDRILNATDLTAEEVVKMIDNPDVLKVMLAAMREHPAFRLLHGRFAPLQDKIAQVKSWPGINPADVDAAVALAMENGTIAGYEAESGKNPLLGIVITVYRESVPATLLYARDRMRESHGDRYYQRNAAYAEGVNEKRVKLLEGSKPFTPNRIVVEVVDLGANWNRKDGVIGRNVQKAQASQLASFAVLYAASQSPEWVRQMDGEKVPYALAAALLLNVPGCDGWACMPSVWRNGAEVRLDGSHVDGRFHYVAFPVLREYKR